MAKHLLHLITAGIILLGFGSSAAMAQPASRGPIDVPPVPADIGVEEGHTVFMKGHAAGTQNYICLPTDGGPKWTFVAPQATLFQRFKGDSYQQNMTHFLAAVPPGVGSWLPSWLHSSDSSQVWARKKEDSDDSAYVEAGAIPWLLLEVVEQTPGPAGGALLAQTTFIQRLNTSGGLAPASTCTQIGALALVPYTADYFFYRAGREK